MKLVLLDRDGVLNIDRFDSVKSVDEFEMIDGAAQAVSRLNRAGLIVALVTNQSVVGRGVISQPELDLIHDKLKNELAVHDARLDAIYYCTATDKQNDPRRKPNPGMILEAIDDLHSTPDKTVMIGDDRRDLEAAAAAGCHRILVMTGKGKKTLAMGLPMSILPVQKYESISEAVDTIIAS